MYNHRDLRHFCQNLSKQCTLDAEAELRKKADALYANLMPANYGTDSLGSASIIYATKIARPSSNLWGLSTLLKKNAAEYHGYPGLKIYRDCPVLWDTVLPKITY